MGFSAFFTLDIDFLKYIAFRRLELRLVFAMIEFFYLEYITGKAHEDIKDLKNYS